ILFSSLLQGNFKRKSIGRTDIVSTLWEFGIHPVVLYRLIRSFRIKWSWFPQLSIIAVCLMAPFQTQARTGVCTSRVRPIWLVDSRQGADEMSGAVQSLF